MNPVLVRFVRELRREGVQVSPAELLDAARAIEAVGPERRDRFRSALRATLVKEQRHREAFDRAFERFFSAPRLPRRKGKGARTGAGAGLRAGPAREAARVARRESREPGRDEAREYDRPVKRPAGLPRRLSEVRDGPRQRLGRLRRLLGLEKPREDGMDRSSRAMEPGRVDLTAMLVSPGLNSCGRAAVARAQREDVRGRRRSSGAIRPTAESRS